MPVEEQQELQRRIEAKTKQEKGKKGKPKKKTKLETSETGELELQIPTGTPLVVKDIQPDTTPQTPNMPRGDRRNERNGNDGDDDRGQNRNHFGHLETFPNLREKVNNHSNILWNLKITW